MRSGGLFLSMHYHLPNSKEVDALQKLFHKIHSSVKQQKREVWFYLLTNYF